jgi:hypothetical protein
MQQLPSRKHIFRVPDSGGFGKRVFASAMHINDAVSNFVMAPVRAIRLPLGACK